MEPFLPDEIKFGLRMPSRYAVADIKSTYRNKVEDEVMRYLNENLKHNYFNPDQELNLDMTVQEVEWQMGSTKALMGPAESGELKKMHEECLRTEKQLDAEMAENMEAIDDLLSQVNTHENAIYDSFNQYGISGINKHTQEDNFLDYISGSTGDKTANNFSLIQNQNYGFDLNQQNQIEGQLAKLKHFMEVKRKIYEWKKTIAFEMQTRVHDDKIENSYEHNELEAIVAELDAVIEAAEVKGTDSQAAALSDAFDELLKNKIVYMIETMRQYETHHTGRTVLYNRAHLKDDSEANDNFRQGILKHLATSIYVKEHRQRYQKEQFDRYVASTHNSMLFKTNITLREWCKYYGAFIDVQVDESHNYRCHKIEANYDDYNQKVVRPINSTIFYYFFSLDRNKRFWARWLVSAARYPNDQMRAAYMKYFSF